MGDDAGSDPGRVVAAATRRPTVVVADDSPDLRYVLKLALGHEGDFDVVGEAGDGESAVQLTARHQPDLVVLDLAMPGMDGLMAIPGIRAASPATKILVLSGFDDDRIRQAALTAGAHAYAPKGMATAALLEVADGLCPSVTGSRGRAPSPSGPSLAAAPPVAPELHRSTEPPDPVDYLVHELRTPVSVVRGLSQTLAERGNQLSDVAIAEIIQTLHRNASHLAAVLEATGAYRVDRRTPRRVERTDLTDLTRQVVADLAGVLGSHRVVIRAAERLEVDVDPVGVRQIVTNLLGNAAKFSEPASPITVEVRPGVTAAEVAVIDAGYGVPAAHRDRLFQRFGRLGHRAEGMGLGLYLSRTIAEAHGGSLELEHSGPEGSSFVLTLPLAGVPATADLGA